MVRASACAAALALALALQREAAAAGAPRDAPPAFEVGLVTVGQVVPSWEEYGLENVLALPSEKAVGRWVDLVASRFAYAGITEDGEVIAWGTDDRGGVSSAKGSGWIAIWAGDESFAALHRSGTVAVWGAAREADTSAVADDLYDVQRCNFSSFWRCETAHGPVVFGASSSWPAVPSDAIDVGSHAGLDIVTSRDGWAHLWRRGERSSVCRIPVRQVHALSFGVAGVSDEELYLFHEALVQEGVVGCGRLEHKTCSSLAPAKAGAKPLVLTESPLVGLLSGPDLLLVWPLGETCGREGLSGVRQAWALRTRVLVAFQDGAHVWFWVADGILQIEALETESKVVAAVATTYERALLLESGAVLRVYKGAETPTAKARSARLSTDDDDELGALLSSRVTAVYSAETHFLAVRAAHPGERNVVMWSETEVPPVQNLPLPRDVEKIDSVIVGQDSFVLVRFPAAPTAAPVASAAPTQAPVTSAPSVSPPYLDEEERHIVAASLGGLALATIAAVLFRRRHDGLWRKHVFISYKHATGRAMAMRLHAALRRQGVTTWMDTFERDAALPDMLRGVERSRALLLVLTGSVMDSPFVQREVAHALGLGRPIIIVLEEGSSGESAFKSDSCPAWVLDALKGMLKQGAYVILAGDDADSAAVEVVYRYRATAGESLWSEWCRRLRQAARNSGGDAAAPSEVGMLEA